MECKNTCVHAMVVEKNRVREVVCLLVPGLSTFGISYCSGYGGWEKRVEEVPVVALKHEVEVLSGVEEVVKKRAGRPKGAKNRIRD